MGQNGKLSNLLVNKISSFSLTVDFYFRLCITKKQDPAVSYSDTYCKKHYFQKEEDGEKRKSILKSGIINRKLVFLNG